MPNVKLFGHKMHYEMQGKGEPILLLHGNPSSSYSWRKVIPHLAELGCVIAIDHMGFGQSDKPPIEYSFFQHAAFLNEFINAMRLSNITLVIQDWGSALGFDYAARNPQNIRGIMFYEAIIKPYANWEEFPRKDPNDKTRELFQHMRDGEVGGLGWKLNIEQNIFITQLLPNLLSIKLSEAEMNHYRRPFEKPDWRKPIWRLTKEIPVAGHPADMEAIVSAYSRAMVQSGVPKLLIWSSTGATIVEEHVEWLKRNFINLEIVKLKSGVHFFQESNVDEFVAAFRAWFSGIESSSQRVCTDRTKNNWMNARKV